MTITSVRQAAAACNVTPPVVRRWLSLGLITEPPWTLQQLHQVRDETDPQGRRRGPQVAHGTLTRWLEGCDCDECHEAQNDASRARGRARAQKRLPAEVRLQLLDAIHSGQPFRTVLRDLGLTSNQVWGLTKPDEEWSEKLDTALTATRRDDLQHGSRHARSRTEIAAGPAERTSITAPTPRTFKAAVTLPYFSLSTPDMLATPICSAVTLPVSTP
jgi:hypothetical protein